MKSKMYVDYLTEKKDSNGNKHWSLARYNRASQTVSYFNDLVFKKEDLAIKTA